MGFIEAMLNPKFLPKVLLKEGLEVPPKNKGKQNIKTEKTQNYAVLDAALPYTNTRPPVPPVQRRTAGRASVFAGCACSASGAWPCTPVVCPCRTPVPCTVFLRFAILDAQGFLEPLIFLEIAFNVLFSIETR